MTDNGRLVSPLPCVHLAGGGGLAALRIAPPPAACPLKAQECLLQLQTFICYPLYV